MSADGRSTHEASVLGAGEIGANPETLWKTAYKLRGRRDVSILGRESVPASRRLAHVSLGWVAAENGSCSDG